MCAAVLHSSPEEMTTFSVGVYDTQAAQKAFLSAPFRHGWKLTAETIRLLVDYDGPESSFVVVWESTSASLWRRHQAL